jgi:3-deoxy-D-manno-octulosonate 8-phosphate phosphatase (KDO 8-P phosphatase)
MKVYQLKKRIQQKEKNKIAAVITDVDGVLTDGKIHLNEQGKEIFKSFHAKDGIACKELREQGIPIIIISGRQSEIVTKRMKELHVEQVYQKVDDKKKKYHEIKNTINLDGKIIYIGDDLSDISLMNETLSFCPKDAHEKVKEIADVILDLKGGEGCLSEVVNYLKKQNML